MGVVTGMDLTNDPKNGIDSKKFADSLVIAKDKRIKYVISHGRIASGTGQKNKAWVWRPYTGKNAHSKHVHISVKPEKAMYDSTGAWKYDAGTAPSMPAPKPAPKPDETDVQTMAVTKGDRGPAVVTLQTNLTLLGYMTPITGYFDDGTEKVVKDFQRDNGLRVDGAAGIQTNTKIGDALQTKETKPKLTAAKRIVNDAAAPGKTISTTEIAAGVAGLGGVATAADNAKQSIDSAASLYQTVINLGPWIIVGLLIVGAAGYIYYERRQKRLNAREAQEVIAE